MRLYLRAARIEHLEIVGIGCHIGSLLADAAPFVAAVDRLGRLADRLAAAGVALRHIDVGGGIGIAYRDDDTQQPIRAFVAGTLAALGQRAQKLIFDPGRSIVGNAGVLLTRVEYVKPGRVRNFLVVDCAMNDLLRPPLAADLGLEAIGHPGGRTPRPAGAIMQAVRSEFEIPVPPLRGTAPRDSSAGANWSAAPR